MSRWIFAACEAGSPQATLFKSGMRQEGLVMHHRDGLSQTTDTDWELRGRPTVPPERLYGASLLFPNIDPLHTDAVMVLGGSDFAAPPALPTFYASAAIAKGTAAAAGPFYPVPANPPNPQGWNWQSLPSMENARLYPNAVILPDASILVFGGVNAQGQVRRAERYAGGDAWQQLDDAWSDHDYHSGAVLLPNGKVLVAGGDSRKQPDLPQAPCDYEVFVPPYLSMGQDRPQFVPAPPQYDPLHFNETKTVSFSAPQGATISKVVLMRPGSTTHHSDFDQRYVQLAFSFVGDSSLQFTAPAPPQASNPNTTTGPPGWYMLFLVSSQGVPSLAGWANLQEP